MSVPLALYNWSLRYCLPVMGVLHMFAVPGDQTPGICHLHSV